MNPVLLTGALFLVATFATAGDFEDRVKAGKRAEESPQGAIYLGVLGPAYGGSMRACIPPGSESNSNLGRFQLVAEISPSGRVLNPEVRPATRVSRCFAREFSNSILAAPPLDGTGQTYPIYLEMKVTP